MAAAEIHEADTRLITAEGSSSRLMLFNMIPNPFKMINTVILYNKFYGLSIFEEKSFFNLKNFRKCCIMVITEVMEWYISTALNLPVSTMN